mgnify:CR=1 FL=1
MKRIQIFYPIGILFRTTDKKAPGYQTRRLLLQSAQKSEQGEDPDNNPKPIFSHLIWNEPAFLPPVRIKLNLSIIIVVCSPGPSPGGVWPDVVQNKGRN